MNREAQIVHLYCLCWNDARTLPYFFKHYDDLVDRYFIFDNGSSDGSPDILRSKANVEIAHFDVTGNSFVDEERRLSDEIWKQSRGWADWVVVIDIDEHLYHPDMRGHLARCSDAGITALQALGYEMVADAFPTGDQRLCETIVSGVRSQGHDKLCFFDPDAIEATRFGPGRHTAEPSGRVIWPESREVLMLHYKQLGVDYPIARSAELRRGLKSGDMDAQWGRQYLWTPAFIAQTWAEFRAASEPVPGLGSLGHIDPADYDEEAVVRRSALFDAEWYLKSYPDVGAAGTEPLSHFCAHGWKEGRKPNFYFDPEWYMQSHVRLGIGDRNPLVHYAREGERLGAHPSVLFEPDWYREEYGLGDDASPLAHYLAHRSTGRVSPVPDFDVAQYCLDNPGILGPGVDPFEHSILEDLQPVGAGIKTLPSFAELREVLKIQAPDQGMLVEDRESEIVDLLRGFLNVVPVDEAWYLETYPDVAEGIAAGLFPSAQAHFATCGYFEGRRPSVGTAV